MRKLLFALALFIGILPFTACEQNRIYEQNIDLPDNKWKIEDVKEYAFEIKDPSQAFDIYFNIRNLLSYEYYNLYVSQTLLGPDGNKIYTRLHEMYLMDKKTGEPLGSGTGDIFDHAVLAVKKQRFAKKGNYKIRLTQYMRKNPLPGIMAVGIKVKQTE